MPLLALGALLLAGCGAPQPPDQAPEPFQDVIRAQGLLRLGDPVGALELATTRLEGETALWAHRVTQDARIALGDEGGVQREYRELADADPESALLAYLAGRALLPDDDLARPYFERAVEADPGFAWGHIGLARLEVLRGDMFRAIVQHREQLESNPRDPDLQMSLGFLCLDLRLLRDASKAFRVALDGRPWDPRILGGLGQTLGQLDRGDEALTHLRRALAIDPSRTDLMAAEAYVLFREGNYEDAWSTVILQQEVDGSADELLVARLSAKLDRSLPHVAPLGPVHLRAGVGAP